MKIISLWQPWATFIELEWKTIETRMHKRFNKLNGQRIGIHAAMKWDNDWDELVKDYLLFDEMAMIRQMQLENKIPFGKIICAANVYAVGRLTSSDSKRALIDCRHEYGRYGYLLDQIKSFYPHITAKGHQGIWEYEIE